MKDVELALREVIDEYRHQVPKITVLSALHRQYDELARDTGYDDIRKEHFAGTACRIGDTSCQQEQHQDDEKLEEVAQAVSDSPAAPAPELSEA